LAKNDLNVKLVHYEHNMFNNSSQRIPALTYNNLIKEYMEYIEYSKKTNLKVSNGVEISCEYLKEQII
jgi:pectate lyase